MNLCRAVPWSAMTLIIIANYNYNGFNRISRICKHDYGLADVFRTRTSLQARSLQAWNRSNAAQIIVWLAREDYGPRP